jgi:hypothetical protein
MQLKQLQQPTCFYTATFKLASRPWALSNAFGGAGSIQYATMYHTSSSTKNVIVRQILLYNQSSSAAANYMFEIRRLTSATTPATGNPAITPVAHSTLSPAAELTCLALPTTQGSESSTVSVWGTQELPMGVTGAAGTANPPLNQVPLVLYQDSGLYKREEEAGIVLVKGTAGGIAVVVDASAIATFKCTISAVFEEF